VARQKKNREINIVHFSFFDLLFGAFGAFVFLMIMQVLSNMNTVSMDVQKMFDKVVHEKQALKNELEKHRDSDQQLKNLRQQYDQALSERKGLLEGTRNLQTKNEDLQNRLSSLEGKLGDVKGLQEELKRREGIQKALEEETSRLKGDNERLGNENTRLSGSLSRLQKESGDFKAAEEEKRKLEKALADAKQKLDAAKAVPLAIKSKSFPTLMTDENVHLALAAEGGALPYTWELTGPLPSGLSFNQMTGVISGTVKGTGDFAKSVSVKDAVGSSAQTQERISLKAIKKYEEPKEKVSPWFMILTVICLLLLAYIAYGKYKTHQYIKKMRADGWEPKWVKKAAS